MWVASQPGRRPAGAASRLGTSTAQTSWPIFRRIASSSTFNWAEDHYDVALVDDAGAVLARTITATGNAVDSMPGRTVGSNSPTTAAHATSTCVRCSHSPEFRFY